MSNIRTHELPFPLKFTISQQIAIERGLAEVGLERVVCSGVFTQVGPEVYAVFGAKAGLCICQYSEDMKAQIAFEYVPVHLQGNALALKDEDGRLCIGHLTRCVKTMGMDVYQSWRLVFWCLREINSSLIAPEYAVRAMSQSGEHSSFDCWQIAV